VVIKISTPKEATMYRRKRRILKALVLGFAVAAFAAPAAFANADRGVGYTDPQIAIGPAESSDDRSLYRGTSPQLDPSVIASPDDRVLFRGTSPQLDPQTVGSPDDRSVFRGTETPNVVPVNVTVSSPSDGFQWADASLGAVSTLALVLLMGAATLMVRHQRRRLAAY
jgi:hypothetical protein